MKKYDELYMIRGLAIIGVVVCHQIGFLHASNWINCFTIYAVPSLILCMGITKALSLKNYVKKQNIAGEQYDWVQYTVNSFKSILISYGFCCIVYGVYYQLWNGSSFHELLVAIMECGLSGPFYFMRYYIVLTILAPVLYMFIVMIENPRGGGQKVYSCLSKIGFLLVLWIVGYIFRASLSALSCSYLSLYTFGMMLGLEYESVVKYISRKKFIVFIGWILSLFLASNTFWATVNGIEPVGIDRFIEYTINPPNFGVTMYAVMTSAMFGIIFIKSLNISCLYIPNTLLKILGRYSLDIFLWHILCQNLCVRLWLAFGISIWPLRIITYAVMFGLPILGRYLHTNFKARCTEILQKQQI